MKRGSLVGYKGQLIEVHHSFGRAKSAALFHHHSDLPPLFRMRNLNLKIWFSAVGTFFRFENFHFIGIEIADSELSDDLTSMIR